MPLVATMPRHFVHCSCFDHRAFGFSNQTPLLDLGPLQSSFLATNCEAKRQQTATAFPMRRQLLRLSEETQARAASLLLSLSSAEALHSALPPKKETC